MVEVIWATRNLGSGVHAQSITECNLAVPRKRNLLTVRTRVITMTSYPTRQQSIRCTVVGNDTVKNG